MRQFFTVLLLMGTLFMRGQDLFPVNGVADKRSGHYAFTHAVIHIDHQNVIHNGTLVIREGRVVEVLDHSGELPEGAAVIDLAGRHIYPGFIDLYSSYGMPPEGDKPRPGNGQPQYESEKRGPFGWNEAIRAYVKASELFRPDEKKARKYREAGFTTLLVQPHDGIVEGSATLLDLSGRRAEESIIRPEAAACYSFDKGSSRQLTPNSLMGSVELLRQSFYDARWYEQARRLPETPFHANLEALSGLMQLPALFRVGDKLSALRAGALSREFAIPFIIMGNGDEYQALDAIADLDLPFILPLHFPLPYELSDPLALEYLPWVKLKHWQMAPYNPRILYEKGVRFSMTMAENESGSDFLKELRKVVRLGLPDSAALKALTYTPARLLGMERELGSLYAGKWASFFISSGNIFEDESRVLESWSRGVRVRVNELMPQDLSGSYELFFERDTLWFDLHAKKGRPLVSELQPDSLFSSMKIRFDRDVMVFQLEVKRDSLQGTLFATGSMNDGVWQGRIKLLNGNYVSWRAAQISAYETEPDTSLTDSAGLAAIPGIPSFLRYPFSPYGFDTLPLQEKVLIKNARVWTNEEEGILERADVLIEGGIIVAIDSGLTANDARVIDAMGMQLTSGIIDEHSHMAVSGGVNEGTLASSSGVRIGDVLNSEDVNIYRQLAGGVTSSQILHGSANPIGGQSALIKLRWGAFPSALKFENAAPFIKFALGENVKQSNWGDRFRSRYPQSRMGVEQFFYDNFYRAEAYVRAWNEYYALSKREQQSRVAPRRDLRLEALAEVLHGERFITCHSYVQSEINMLLKVADSFHFRLNTFTHVLEGYKVADKLKAHGAGASTFSDWWAYKFEVRDAIPYNAALLVKMGVTTAINSDDREMARRLNQEAAKTIKYGGLSEEEAWKTVTINPARLLQINHRTGSIRVGKDADLVLWSGNPLSIYSKAMMTFVDGRLLFDRSRDAYLRKRIQKERQALIQEMYRSEETQRQAVPPYQPEKKYHCDDVEDYFNHEKTEE